MIQIDLKDYQERPIFVHIINRELHDSLDKQVDHNNILLSLRVFSVVSGQTMFCNISQISEVFYNHSEALNEITELSKIDRFVAHSDYGSFKEFRESRVEIFGHSPSNHPSFFNEPSDALKTLPSSSMGQRPSTTVHIETNLTKWLESDPTSSLQKSLSPSDAKKLRENENWVARTLENRHGEALTYDVFSQSLIGPVSEQSEGAVRRSLTESYIDSYLTSYDPICIWGFSGINHYERMQLLSGMNYYFAQAILRASGVDAHLRKTESYGQFDRMILEGSSELALFRLRYAELALAIDQQVPDNSIWHKHYAIIKSCVQKLLQSSSLTPRQDGENYSDVLKYAGDALLQGKEYLNPTTPTVFASPRQVVLAEPEVLIKQVAKQNPTFDYWLVPTILGGFLMGIACFLSLPEFVNLSTGVLFLLSSIATIISGGVIYYFGPKNRYWRLVPIGLFVIGYGGGLRFEFSGGRVLGVGSISFGQESSIPTIIVGVIIVVAAIIADYHTRKSNP